MTESLQSREGASPYRRLAVEAAGLLQVRRVLFLILGASLVTNVLLAWSVSRYEPKVRTVVLAPGPSATYVAADDAVSENLLERFAVSALGLVTNVQPGSAAWQIERFLEHVAPESYGAISHRLRTGVKELERNQAAAFLAVTASSVDAAARRVCLKGEERTYIARTQTSADPVTVCLTLDVRQGRLWIVDLEKTSHRGAKAGVSEGTR